MKLPENLFEARYIRITWLDKSSALNIKTSKDSIEIVQESETNFELEATAFSKVDAGVTGQLAFSVLDEKITEPLYFDKPNGDKSQLIPVLDNETKRTWWVEGEIWSKGTSKEKYENKRWQSEIFRSAGEVKLRVGKYSCSIKIRSHSFTHEQLQNYLQDFKNELWYLVLHETSYISAPVKDKQTKILNDSTLNYFHRYIAFTEKILDKPKSELRESQEKKACGKSNQLRVLLWKLRLVASKLSSQVGLTNHRTMYLKTSIFYLQHTVCTTYSLILEKYRPMYQHP